MFRMRQRKSPALYRRAARERRVKAQAAGRAMETEWGWEGEVGSLVTGEEEGPKLRRVAEMEPRMRENSSCDEKKG